jgi:hypothetical protein
VSPFIIIIRVKKLVFLLLAAVFIILGLIGLAIPVVPQVPFFVVAALLIASVSERFRHFVISNKFYRKHLKQHVMKHKTIKKMLYHDDIEDDDKVDQSLSNGMDMQ